MEWSIEHIGKLQNEKKSCEKRNGWWNMSGI